MRESVEWPTRDPLSHRAVTTPERTAVVDVGADREWTYRAFDTIVDGVTARLQSVLGTAAGGTDRSDDATDRQRVGLLASTRVGFFAAVHATWRAGRSVVPLDTALTTGGLQSRLDGVGLAALVCERATEATALAAADCPVVSLDAPGDESVDALQPAGATESEAVEPARWRRDDEAVVMFTSGTTGEPKGVRLTLGNLVASATAAAFRLGVSPGDRWLCCLPAYHMGGLAPGVRCPLYGTTLLVQSSFDADETAEALATHGAAGVSLVPTQLKRLLDSGWEPSPSLETVLVGGAPAGEDLVERAIEAGVPVYPTYGATETASQIATATPADAEAYPKTVGQPLVVTDVTVVDESGRPVEAGETGEIVVDGPTVTPGYLDDERTERAFGTHGFHTSDVGYRDGDGRLWVLGRADDTIITGGENVHPSEVEAVLTSHPDVSDAAVVGLDDDEWGERVAALLVPADVDPENVDEFARDRLADYKVPKLFARAPSLPRTASGTVDREAVRERLRDRR